MQSNAYTSQQAYKRTDVETASQGKLVIMLFNGAIQRAEEARRLIDRDKRDVNTIHARLVRAQDIVAELRSALNMQAGEVAHQLDRVYEYIFHLLVQANIKKDGTLLDEAVQHLTELRDAWAEAFAAAALEGGAPAARINPHGAALMNLEG